MQRELEIADKDYEFAISTGDEELIDAAAQRLNQVLGMMAAAK